MIVGGKAGLKLVKNVTAAARAVIHARSQEPRLVRRPHVDCPLWFWYAA